MININLQIIEECKSTNASLIKLAKEGYPEGYSLLSINQTCGRGTKIGRAHVRTPVTA